VEFANMAKTSNTDALLQPRLISIKAAAAYLSCTIWAVRTLVWNRQVASLKIGNKILFDRKDLDAYIDAQKTAVA
jgi:excisionase family DNA binding protein